MKASVSISPKKWLALAGILVSFALSLGVGSQIATANDVSPVWSVAGESSAMTTRRTNALGTLDAAGNNNLYHVLKKENTSQVYDVDMFAYFNNPSAARYIEITSKNTNPADRCETHGPQQPAGTAPQATGNYYIAVTLSTVAPSPASSVTYRIPRDQVCGTYTAGTSNGGARPLNDSYFFARFPAPAGFASAVRDPNTNLFKLRVTIDLNRSVPAGTTSGSNRQQVMFKVRTDSNCAPLACTNNRFLSAIQTGGRNTSTLGSDTGAQYKNQFQYFGLPCSVSTAQTRTLTIYDADNQSPAGSWDDDDASDDGSPQTPMSQRYARFKVQYRNAAGTWVSLPVGSYTLTTAGSLVRYPTATSDQMILPDNDPSSVTTVSFTMQPRTQYRVQLGPIWSGNLVGYGLPEENIFGRISCNVAVTGNITTNPVTGPVNVGTSTSFSPEIVRSGSSIFGSNISYVYRTWFDTGDGTYQVGEELATNPNCQQTGVTNFTGNGVTALAVCTTVADTARSSGNATRVCGQLVLTAIDTLSQVTQPAIRCLNIGKSPHLAALNGDVFGGGAFLTAGSCQINNSVFVSGNNSPPIGGANYGSYATYGVTSLGVSRAFASNNLRAGDVNGGALVFSNRTESTYNGFFLHDNGSVVNPPTPRLSRCLTNPFTTYASRTTPAGALSSVDISTLAASGATTGRSYTGGTLTITAPAGYRIPLGAKVIIYAQNADVKIDSDIIYQDTGYASVDQLPQLVILSSRDIIVDETVRQIDGVLAAQRDIITCELSGPATTTLRLNVCEEPFALNGIAIAGNVIRPLRTYGAEQSVPNSTTYDTVAETFSLRPDTLLSQLPGPGSANVYMRTVHENEAPPRY